MSRIYIANASIKNVCYETVPTRCCKVNAGGKIKTLYLQYEDVENLLR